MSQIAEAYVRVRPDTTGFKQDVTRTVTRDLRGVERQLQTTNREMSRFGRGALVGTGALRELGRAAAFASLSFIGGAGIVVGIRSTIKAAMEAQASLAQTQNAVERAGVSWAQYGQRIQDAALEQSQLSGIDDERFQRTFATLLRATGDVNRALEDNALAANIARGANIELEQAAKIVARAEAGQARGLAQLGVVLEKGADRVEILTALQEKFAGSTAAFADTAAGAQARFAVAINETQEAIGTALLPITTEYLNKLTEWLNKTENQEKIQRRAGQAADITARSFELVGQAIDVVTTAVEKLRDLPLGDQGSHGIMAALLGRIPGFDTGTRKLGEDIYFLADALGLVADNMRDVASAEDLVWAARKRAGMQPSSPAWGIPPEFFTQGDQAGPLGLAGGPVQPVLPSLNRGQQTAVDLAKAQAGGQRAAIEAAIQARLDFVRDTIAFANKLISEGRGDITKLGQTLERFYGEQENLNSMLQGFADADEQARLDAIDAANQRAADWRDANHQIQLAFAAARKQGRLFHEAFSRSVAEQAQDQRDRIRTRDSIQEQILDNRLLAAQLKGDNEKARNAQRAIIKLQIKHFNDIADDMWRGRLEREQAKGRALQARSALRALNQKERDERGGGFTLAELFQEAGEQFEQFGSNIGPRGVPLSAQDAKASLAQTVKTHQVHVTQIFNIPVPTSQAMIDARNAARNLQ